MEKRDDDTNQRRLQTRQALVQQEGKTRHAAYQQRYLEYRAAYALYQQRYQEYQRKLNDFLYEELNFAYYLHTCEQMCREFQKRRNELKKEE